MAKNYNLKPLQEHFENISPKEIAQVLDQSLLDLVYSAEQQQDYSQLSRKYIDILFLRNAFAEMDENLKGLWK